MDIRQLSYFIEVAKLNSYTKASQSLHLSQSTLSKVVKALEEELQVELIDRSSKQIKLTAAGEIIFAEGVKILESVDGISNHLYDLMNLKKGKVKIGIPPIIGFLFFPKIVKGFKSRYPDIEIKIQEEDSKTVKQLVKDGELDFAVAMLPAEEDDFNVIPFVNDELSLFVNESHQLAQHEEVSLIDLKDEQFILIKHKLYYDLIVQACFNEGFAPKIAFESGEWEFISGLIAENLGVSIFPRFITNKVSHDPIKPIRIINPTLPWDLGIITNKKKKISPAVSTFIDYLITHKQF